ncbi:MAG: sulfatase [Sphingobacteriales bacterium 17-39-43]|uniref:sulfatase-like hydrolase/transferase n=1 Tax=Daejeonella sp. TaxID=2805397 RepID=UPI000BCC3B34|nr:sulfatase-like hydrolase/transferase [Daejeonella sp.]OYY03846.1 MAG: sulfatase [Sphingobacteriia bacterium 35-40-5]OYZ31985.1 MAG: sulfatase [Sphingobacteriales bacterium 16-39-50]OZA25289.1 MAG: sulfatase [Sphingobacteriales bacterium 17-39-43]HQS04155.1 sulfatase-like hydrolase/transferase [Daejeonella sp.]HQS50893.1 sulfatase-like hydrolase/transferase [Daejeonella sp.]
MRIIALILVALILPTSIIAQKITARAKNILIIYSDDHSYHALGAAGNKEISTPNLDKLAKSGLMFTQAHVMGGHQGAVCIPSRVMLLTGRYVNRLPGDGSTIPDSIVSLPEVLRKQGYNTYHTGKWHSDKASHSRMFSTGGDIFFGGMHFPKFGGQEHPTVSLYDSTGVYNDSRKRVSDIYSTTLYADNAVRFLNSSTAKAKPFFCYVAFTSPHDPRTPPGNFATMYDPKKITLPSNFLIKHPFDNGDLNVRDEQLLPVPRDPEAIKKDIALYYGMVSEMDAQVGRILEALEKSGLKENTLIVFAGDNGLAVGQHGLLGKQNLYEHSIRVPMIMSGPGIPVNKKTEGFTYLSDITPTIIDYLAVKRPSSVEGRSLLPVIQDPSKKVRSSIYNVYGHWSRSIKSDDGFKMIVYNVDGITTTQLFNLKKDPLEIKDISKEPAYSEKILQMRNLLKQQMTAAFDDLNIDLPDWGRKKNQKSRGS